MIRVAGQTPFPMILFLQAKRIIHEFPNTSKAKYIKKKYRLLAQSNVTEGRHLRFPVWLNLGSRNLNKLVTRKLNNDRHMTGREKAKEDMENKVGDGTSDDKSRRTTRSRDRNAALKSVNNKSRSECQKVSFMMRMQRCLSVNGMHSTFLYQMFWEDTRAIRSHKKNLA